MVLKHQPDGFVCWFSSSKSKFSVSLPLGQPTRSHNLAMPDLSTSTSDDEMGRSIAARSISIILLRALDAFINLYIYIYTSIINCILIRFSILWFERNHVRKCGKVPLPGAFRRVQPFNVWKNRCWFLQRTYMEVSINGGPEWMVYNGRSIYKWMT